MPSLPNVSVAPIQTGAFPVITAGAGLTVTDEEAEDRHEPLVAVAV